MKILSIETSSNICSVAILEDQKVIKEISLNDPNTHSVKLMPLVQEILQKTNLTISDIDLFACDKGPGSFTGIRIGIATIKAFCDISLKPGFGISSLTALAYQSDYEGLICSLIDAKNDNVYYGLFERKNGIYTQIGDLLTENINYITEILKNCHKPIFFVGNGSIVYEDVIKSTLKKNAIILKEDRYTNLTAISIAIVAFDYNQNNVSSSLSPLYLRKSNAEREWEEKHECDH